MTVLASLVAALGSASAPKAHNVQKSTSVHSSADETWSAVIDVFADHNWEIDKMDKASGLITTDWMRVGDDEERFADCGSAPLAVKSPVQIRFNVRVRDDGDETALTVNASFRQARSVADTHGVIECTSTGTVESMIQEETNAAISAHERHRAKKAAKTDEGSGSRSEQP